jgi:hypothetical protein
VVGEVTARGLLRLRGRPFHDGYLPSRFRLAVPAPFKPHIGSLDEEYGPANTPEDPIHRAIGKRWSNHHSDVLIHLDELKARGQRRA